MRTDYPVLPLRVLLIMSMLLSACRQQDSQEQLGDWLDLAEQQAKQASESSKVKADHPSFAAQATETATATPASTPYLSAQLRSPFDRHQDNDAATTLASAATRPPQRGPHQALEDHSLESLTLVGTLLRNHDSNSERAGNALIRAADKIHRVKVGDYLGPDFGQVSRISADTVELEELYPEVNGSWRIQQRLLHFPGVTR